MTYFLNIAALCIPPYLKVLNVNNDTIHVGPNYKEEAS